MSRPNMRSAFAAALAAGILIAACLHGVQTRQALGMAIAVWWDHIVPILLPGYVLAQALLSLRLRPAMVWIVLLALFTMPPLVLLVLWDWARQRRIPARQLAPLLLYTNIYNPLFFPDPSLGLLLDGASLTAALLLCPPGRWMAMDVPVPEITPRQWILDGMNWTSIVGLLATAAWVVHAWLAPLKAGWLIDPVSMHWGGTATRIPGHWTVFWTALGGVAFWAPFVPAVRSDGRWVRFGIMRLAQALFAAAAVLAAGKFWPGL